MNATSSQESDPPDRPAELSIGVLVRRMLGLSWRYRLDCVVVLLQQMGLVLLTLAGFGLTGLGIDVIRHRLAPGASPPKWPLGWAPPADWSTIAVVAWIAILIFVAAAAHAALRFFAAVSQARLIQKVVIQLRTDVYDKLQRLSFRFFDAHESGSIINRVTADVQAVRMFVDSVVIQALIVVLSLVAYLGYMFQIHVGLTLACLATTPLLWIGAVRFSQLVKPEYLRASELVDKMILALSENAQGAMVVKGFALEDREIERFRAANDAIADQKGRIFWIISLYQPTIGFLTQCNMIVLLGYGGWLALQGEVLLGEGLFVFANLLSQFANQVSQITNIANSVQTSLTGAQRVFEILDAPVEIRSPASPTLVPNPQGAVRFEGVAFAYGPESPVLHDIHFDARPGQLIAIVGATGAGKSTLLSLIPRFYDAGAGRVLVDGVDVREWDLDVLRRNVGIVFQESFLFSASVASNIAFGHPEATMEQIERAARLSAADQFIDDLPGGYDAIIGEHGCNISGGQRQRLAIARALLLEPTVLILDDATAAIDPETEHEIQEAMENAAAGRTTFVIAHRLATLRRADAILVLEEGRIVDRGVHEELLARPGPYQRLARAQFGVEDVELALALRNGDRR